MKIGILTFHCAHNYGAVLQCYALQEMLKNMGYKVEVIDYRPEYLLAPYRKFSLSRFKRSSLLSIAKVCVKEFLLLVKRIRRYNAFQTFINKRFNLSPTVNDKSIPSFYDVYIMGSDQIWNPKITKGFDPVYFGFSDFDKGNRKYISYAASMETKEVDKESKDFFEKALMNFDAVSVRETQLKTLLQPLTGKNIELVLDPTLLADKKIWDAIAIRPNINKKYILVYQVRYNVNTIRIARQLAKDINAEIIEVTSSLRICFSNKSRQCESPEEFLGWIKNADCVVTTSFHGTAFSIIFNRPFYCIKLDDEFDTRSASLLKSLGLEYRFIDKKSTPTLSPIDYSVANERLSHLQIQSIDFLSKALEGYKLYREKSN